MCTIFVECRSYMNYLMLLQSIALLTWLPPTSLQLFSIWYNWVPSSARFYLFKWASIDLIRCYFSCFEQINDRCQVFELSVVFWRKAHCFFFFYKNMNIQKVTYCLLNKYFSFSNINYACNADILNVSSSGFRHILSCLPIYY